MFSSPFVVGPIRLSECDIFALPFLRAAMEQDHRAFPVPAKINAVAGARVNLAFRDAHADAFDSQTLFLRPFSLRQLSRVLTNR